MSFARAAWPWALAVALAAVFMVTLARLVLPTPPRVDATTHPNFRDAPDELAAQSRGSLEGVADVPTRTAVLPHGATPGALSQPPGSDPAASLDATSASNRTDMERVWQRVASLSARLDALGGDGGASGRTAAAALRMIEVPQILEEAGISDEPFAARLAAYRNAVVDGGHPDTTRASVFAPEDLDRLRLLDALHAL